MPKKNVKNDVKNNVKKKMKKKLKKKLGDGRAFVSLTNGGPILR